MNEMNRLYTAQNPYQGESKRVLCVCSAGLLRSPTAALVLSQPPFNYNTRAAGAHSYALVRVDKVLIRWAQEIVCMQSEHADALLRFDEPVAPVVVLDIPDNFSYRDPTLMDLIVAKYSAVIKVRQR